MKATYVGGKKTRIGVGVRSREAKQLVLTGDSRAVPANLDLLTGGIKLGFTLCGRQVEGDDLVPNQILSWSEIFWKGGIGNGPVHFLWA
jgi:hypothetical protein